jgi:hypothetical protein
MMNLDVATAQAVAGCIERRVVEIGDLKREGVFASRHVTGAGWNVEPEDYSFASCS